MIIYLLEIAKSLTLYMIFVLVIFFYGDRILLIKET